MTPKDRFRGNQILGEPNSIDHANSTKTIKTSTITSTRQSVAGVKLGGLQNTKARQSIAQNLNFRQSNALASIQAFQSKNAGSSGGNDIKKRASINLGMGDGASDSDAAELRIENDRLKTTLMILNQKMKIQEDNEDLVEKWKSQTQSKEGQISILNDQINSLTDDCEKMRKKAREQSSNIASLESDLHSF